MHMLLILLALCLRKPNGISHLFSIAYAFAGNGCYLNKIRSSRKLEHETQRNIEVRWLWRKLTPDFKTIADFRKDNPQALKQVCREFTLLCKQLDLFGRELLAIAGSKFKAVNSLPDTFARHFEISI
jgi:transposase